MIYKFKEYEKFIDVYNTAFHYLYNKYGAKMGYTSAFDDKLNKCRNNEERKKLLDNITDRDYTTVIKDDTIKDRNDKEIYLLLQQYPFGIRVKDELHNKLFSMGIVNEKSDNSKVYRDKRTNKLKRVIDMTEIIPEVLNVDASTKKEWAEQFDYFVPHSNDFNTNTSVKTKQ